MPSVDRYLLHVYSVNNVMINEDFFQVLIKTLRSIFETCVSEPYEQRVIFEDPQASGLSSHCAPPAS